MACGISSWRRCCFADRIALAPLTIKFCLACNTAVAALVTRSPIFSLIPSILPSVASDDSKASIASTYVPCCASDDDMDLMHFSSTIKYIHRSSSTKEESSKSSSVKCTNCVSFRVNRALLSSIVLFLGFHPLSQERYSRHSVFLKPSKAAVNFSAFSLLVHFLKVIVPYSSANLSAFRSFRVPLSSLTPSSQFKRGQRYPVSNNRHAAGGLPFPSRILTAYVLSVQLVVSPPLINTGTFITVVRMLTTMCSCCPELALTLLKNNIAETLCYLLTGRVDTSQGEIELVPRSPQEVYEMTCLICELMPRLPQHTLFAVDALLDRPSAKTPLEIVSWQWRDDMGVWHAYTILDSRLIEAAHQTGEDEASLSTLGRTYTVDFHSMQQINEDTGTSRAVERRVIRPQALQSQSSINNNTSPMEESAIDNNLRDVAGPFIRSLFSVLYEVYSSSAGPAVRCKCLKALLRMVYFASPELLKEVLKAQTVSSQLAGMMASQDLRIIVSALQIAEILMQKLPDLFAVHFTREANNVNLGGGRRTKMTARMSTGGARRTSSFLASFNPVRWGRTSAERSFHQMSYTKVKEPPLAKCPSSTNLWAGNREKVRAWVRERSSKFIQTNSGGEGSSTHDPSQILANLTSAIATLQSEDGNKRNALIDLRNTLMTCDISPFEVHHSGFVKALLDYLTLKTRDRDDRIRLFLNVFSSCPLTEISRDASSMDSTCFQMLVSKLNSCISQLEQFPVKVHDLPAPAGSTTALKFFNTHQLKCQLLRHPDCTSLKQWKGGTVKIDPLALVQAIERYLVVRGYAKIRDKHSSQSDDDNTEEDNDDPLVEIMVAGTRHKLQFLINDTVLPYNMTVYQAVRQFSPAAGGQSDQSETDTDTEAPLGSASIWVQTHIVHYSPFLLPFETRQLLLYATAFDRDRALQRLLDSSPELSSASDSQERVTPRLDRRKRTVAREEILKQAETLIQDMAASKALLEVQYENEVGTGLGPTLEFYALVSRELQRADLELWHDESGTCSSATITADGNHGQPGYVFSSVGLFPSPIPRGARVSHVVKLKAKFRFIGKFMAKAVMDSRMLDLPLSRTFYRWLLGEESSLGLADLAYVNPSVHKTLVRLMGVVGQYKEILASNMHEDDKKAKIENLDLDGCPIESLGLDFTLPGYLSIELRKGGKDIAVTPYNLEDYIKLVVHWYLVEGVHRQMECVREGMQSVFPTSHLSLFYPAELDAVFCGSSTGWEVSALVESCRPDHGYTASSRAIKFLFEILSTYGPQDQRDFVQFVTGSPRLPVGGFKALSPPLTIVRKTMDSNMNADDFLPSVMTCVNYLKLPDYSTIEIMREKLRIAAKEGQRSFHLS
ncbi:unnamed protein product [Nesidiocoris tenuis]|uniref:E3 ubiquitin-protein ligase n=1 Tax=Nesidiocoris tenuis TaxID=355587 RepID=A0A6H5H169_9HEMI|nr:unnamed protein product [Nesidiocoris tenuis]